MILTIPPPPSDSMETSSERSPLMVRSLDGQEVGS